VGVLKEAIEELDYKEVLAAIMPYSEIAHRK